MKQATVRIWFRTVAIDVCLIFNVVVVFSSKYFRFMFVKLSLSATGLQIGEAHRMIPPILPIQNSNIFVNILSSEKKRRRQH